jgi:hypothetical protein
LSAISRAKMSLMLPAENGTTIRTIWLGNEAVEWAELAKAADNNAAAHARTNGKCTKTSLTFPRLVDFETRLNVGVFALELHSCEQTHRLQQRTEIRGKVFLRIRL